MANPERDSARCWGYSKEDHQAAPGHDEKTVVVVLKLRKIAKFFVNLGKVTAYETIHRWHRPYVHRSL